MLARKIAYNTLISTGARIIGLALSLVTLGFLTRYLGQEGFGQYSTMLAFLYIFSVVADLGLYSICVRDMSRPGADEQKIVSNAFTARMTFGLAAFILAPLIGSILPYSIDTKVGILIGAMGFWFMSGHHVLISVFQKYLRMDKASLAEFISRAVQLGLVVLFVSQDWGFLFIVGAFVGGAAVNFALIYYFAKKHIPIKIEFDFKFWKKLIKASIPLGVASILTMIYFKLDTVMLSFFKGQAEVGIYGLSYKILESLLFFPVMFVGLMMPLMSKYALSDRPKLKRIVQKSLDLILIIVVPLIVATLILSARIIDLLGGQEFLASAGVLNILIVATGIIYIAVLFSNIIISLDKQKTLAYIYGLGAFINVAANVIFIPKYSYYGAAATTVFTELVVTALMMWVVYQALKEWLSFKSIFRPLLAALGMAMFLFVMANLNLFVLVVAAIIIYFGFLYLFGGIMAKDLAALIKKEA